MDEITAPAAISPAGEPLILRDYDYESQHDIVHFAYSVDEQDGIPANVLEVVLRNLDSGERTFLRFRGVELVSFPLLTPWPDAQVVVQNQHHQYDSPRAIEVRLDFGDGEKETMFWARSVETS